MRTIHELDEILKAAEGMTTEEAVKYITHGREIIHDIGALQSFVGTAITIGIEARSIILNDLASMRAKLDKEGN